MPSPALSTGSRLTTSLWGLAIAGALLLPVEALAEPTSAGLAKEPASAEGLADPEHLPTREEMNQNPAATGLLLFDLLERAESAEKNKDYATAAKHYAAIANAVPDRAVAFSKLCEMYQALGERDRGVAACYRATGLEGVKVADYLRYATLLLSKPAGQSFSAAEANELRSTFDHLKESKIDNREVDVLACQFAVAVEDHHAMKQCVLRLEDKLPGSPIALTYQLSLALFERDYSRARALIEEARRINMSQESIALMNAEVAARESDSIANDDARASPPMPQTATLVGVGLGAAAAAALGGLVVWGRRRRPKAAGG